MSKKCVLCGTVASHEGVTLADMTDVVCPGCGCRERLVATPIRMERVDGRDEQPRQERDA